ncbi:nucleotide sugar dehydrogenase [Candidatus Bipolaricaulota sp. J31]
MTAEFPEKIAIIGLGYVGLPLAVTFAEHLPVVGFDVDRKRILELRKGYDRNGEISSVKLQNPSLNITNDPEELRGCDFFIVTVPTPIDQAKRPDLSHLKAASHLVGRSLKKGATVVYESTVYPGCTEEVCMPILEQESGLRAGVDFKVGYSPERINPGDPEHTLENVVKVVAGQDAETTDLLARVYGMVVKAGIYKAPNIKTAEAAKVIENIQRDLNIALINELAMLFHRLDLDTQEVLKAARTKWNFLPFEPGLVGGHCIPVDPYYLTYKAQEVGYHPEVILAGRRVNDEMGRYVAQETVRLLIKAGKPVRGARILVLGITFKENVRDTRNSQVFDLINELESYDCEVHVYDPLILNEEWKRLPVKFVNNPFDKARSQSAYDAMVLAVPHEEFRRYDLRTYMSLFDDSKPGVFVDVKGLFLEKAKNYNDLHELIYWSL